MTVAAIVEREGRFLLVEEETRDGVRLNQPAGHLEAGESLPAAAARETLEETGWTVAATALVGVYRWEAPDSGATFVRFSFVAEALGHDRARRSTPGSCARYGSRTTRSRRGARSIAARSCFAASTTIARGCAIRSTS